MKRDNKYKSYKHKTSLGGSLSDECNLEHTVSSERVQKHDPD
jgi:hypothetical protein